MNSYYGKKQKCDTWKGDDQNRVLNQVAEDKIVSPEH